MTNRRIIFLFAETDEDAFCYKLLFFQEMLRKLGMTIWNERNLSEVYHHFILIDDKEPNFVNVFLKNRVDFFEIWYIIVIVRM